MNAILLAAGVSRRLYPLTHETPKCLLKVGEKHILDYQLSALLAMGVTDIVIVLGYYREMIQSYIRETYPEINLIPIVNHHFFDTNTAYSVNLALPHVNNESFLLMNADVVYPQSLLEKIIHSNYDSVLAVEIKKCGREEVKVIEGKDQRIVAIGKELIQENALGEFIGVARFSAEFGQVFSRSVATLISAGGNSEYFEAGIHPILSKLPVYYEDVTAYPCIEVDFQEDLESAREIIASKWYK